jgi:hypothetical protein
LSEATVADWMRKNIFRLLAEDPNSPISEIIFEKMFQKPLLELKKEA